MAVIFFDASKNANATNLRRVLVETIENFYLAPFSSYFLFETMFLCSSYFCISLQLFISEQLGALGSAGRTQPGIDRIYLRLLSEMLDSAAKRKIDWDIKARKCKEKEKGWRDILEKLQDEPSSRISLLPKDIPRYVVSRFLNM